MERDKIVRKKRKGKEILKRGGEGGRGKRREKKKKKKKGGKKKTMAGTGLPPHPPIFTNIVSSFNISPK